MENEDKIIIVEKIQGFNADCGCNLTEVTTSEGIIGVDQVFCEKHSQFPVL